MEDVLNPKQLLQDGQGAYRRGDFVNAARSFAAAAQGFAAAGDALTEAEMKNNASVAYLKAGDRQAALQVVEGTPAVFAQAGDIRRQGLALGNLGAAYDALNYKAEAIEAYQQSAELLERSGEEEMRAHVLQSLSALQLRSGKQLEAVATMEAGLESFKKPTLKQRLLKRLLRLPFRMMK